MVRQHMAHGSHRLPQSILTKALYALQEIEAMKHAVNKKDQEAQVTQNTNGSAPSVLDIFREAREAIPEEEFEKLPVDGAAQIDHYVYGTPKRSV